jgi:major membrane immunogen (membrane-anchored lipoprotein)
MKKKLNLNFLIGAFMALAVLTACSKKDSNESLLGNGKLTKSLAADDCSYQGDPSSLTHLWANAFIQMDYFCNGRINKSITDYLLATSN